MKQGFIVVAILFVVASCVASNRNQNPLEKASVDDGVDMSAIEPESFVIDSIVSPFEIPDVEERFDTSALGWHLIFRRMSEDKPICRERKYADTVVTDTIGYNTVLYLHVRHDGHDLIPICAIRSDSFSKFYRSITKRRVKRVDITRLVIQSPSNIEITKDSIILFLPCRTVERDLVFGVRTIVRKDGSIAYSRFNRRDYETCIFNPMFFSINTGREIRALVETEYLDWCDFRGIKFYSTRQRTGEIEVLTRIYKNRPGLLDTLIQLVRNSPAEDEWDRICRQRYADELQKRKNYKAHQTLCPTKK